MVGKRTLALTLALVTVLFIGTREAPVAYRVVVLNPRLKSALQKGDLREAEGLIRQGADANLRTDIAGVIPVTALALAVDSSDPRAVRQLLKLGADSNARVKAGSTPVMLAATTGNAGILRLLLTEGGDVRLADDEGLTPLMHAARGSIGWEPAKCVKLLLDAGGDPNARDKQGRTALMHAAGSGTVTVNSVRVYTDPGPMQALIAGGADARLRDDSGDTALALAEQYGERHQIDYLKGIGAPGLGNEYAGVPEGELFYAVRTRDMRSVKRLIRRGARVAVQDRRGRTPIGYAAQQEDGILIHYLLRHAADVKASLELRDTDGYTVLYHTTIHDYSFRKLIEAGADPNNTNTRGGRSTTCFCRSNNGSSSKPAVERTRSRRGVAT